MYPWDWVAVEVGSNAMSRAKSTPSPLRMTALWTIVPPRTRNCTDKVVGVMIKRTAPNWTSCPHTLPEIGVFSG